MNELTTESPYELHKDMKFINEIDQGAFGKVIHVYETKKNLDLAVKVINKGGLGSNLIEQMKEQISILKKLNHKNIVKYYGYSETNNQLLIEMEYIKYGTLSRWMKGKSKIKEEDASMILSSLLSAVEYLHSKQICHRDIKPDNIMFSEENNLSSIKIIDFGLSAQHFNYLTNNDYCGTFIYMAPEQIEKKLYYFSVDIWSIGILMFMLLNGGKHPFYQKNDKKEEFIKKIKVGKLNFTNKLSFMAKNLNQKLCEVNPSWRYSANLAIKHPWITRNPNDKIPLTFNEILNRNNNKKNWNQLVMICIFLNYYKKKEIKWKEKTRDKNNNKSYIDNFIKKKKNKLYYITKKYVNKCNVISEKEREKYLEKRERYLEVISTDEEDSMEKKHTLNINKPKRLSIKKNTNKFNSSQRNKEDRFIHNSNNNIYKKKLHFTTKAPKKLDNLEIKNSRNNNHYVGTNSQKNIYIFSSPNNKNSDYIKYKNKKHDEIKSTNKYKKNGNIDSVNNCNVNIAISKSTTKFNLNSVVNKEFPINIKRAFVDLKKFNLKNNLPNISKNGKIINKNLNLNLNINTTSKKQYHNNFIRNYDITPLVLPFLKA